MNELKKIKNYVVLRLMVVTLVLFVVIFIGMNFLFVVIAEAINQMFVYTDNSTWHSLFYFLSRNQQWISAILVLIVLFFAFQWAIQPMMKYFNILKNAIDQLVDPQYKMKFPHALKEFEYSLQKVEGEIRLKELEVKESEQRKNTMITYLAHDIRTPLTSIIGYQELIRDTKQITKSQIQEFNDISLRKSYRLQVLIDELFELTQFNVGQMEVVRKNINLNVLLTQLREEFLPILAKKQIACELELSGELLVSVDAIQIGRVFENVMNNAIHYAQEGSEIMIVVNKEIDCVKVTISNTGSYIPQEKLNRIFEVFYRGDPARKEDGGRTGVGLAVAKKIIEAHQGNIYAESNEDLTSFFIELPL